MKIKDLNFYKARNGEIVFVTLKIYYPSFEDIDGDKRVWSSLIYPYTQMGAIHPTYYEDGKACPSSPDPIEEWDLIEETEPVHTCLSLYGCKVCSDNGKAAVEKEHERIKNLRCRC